MTASISGIGNVTLDKGSYYKVELMKEEYILLSFKHSQLLPLKIGTTANAGGFSGFVLTEDYAPTYNQARGCYEYNVKFDAPYWASNNLLVKNELNGKILTKFSITDHPGNILKLIADSTQGLWSAADFDSEDWVTLDFDGTYCMDALNALVSAMDENGYYEWWITDGVAHIGKLGGGSGSVTLTEQNVQSVNASKSTTKQITKVYAMGGTKNMSPRIGLPIPNINVTEEKVIIAKVGGSYVGYYDAMHKITGDMFQKSRRSYFTRSASVPFSEVAITQNGTSTSCVYCQVGRNELDKEGRGHVNFVHAENGKLTVNVGLSATGTSSSVTTEYDNFDVTVNVYAIQGIRDDYTKLYKLGGASGKMAPGGVIQLDLYESDILLDSLPPGLAIEVVAENKKSGDDGYAYKVIIQNGVLDFSVTYKDLYCVETGTALGKWNPFYIDTATQDAWVFEHAASGISMDAIGIARSKVPYTWFYESDAYSAEVTAGSECRLSSVADGTPTGELPVEAQIVFEDIYPKIGGVVGNSGVFKTVEEKDTNGELTGRNLIYYSFKSDLFAGLTASDYIEDKVHIVFDLGSTLGGMEFEIAIVGQDDGEAEIAIIPNETYSQLIPNSVLHPEDGDKYSLYGLNAAIYDDGTAVNVAQQQLDAAAANYLSMANVDDGVYNCTIKPTKASSLTGTGLGDAASLSFGGATLSSTRVVGVKRYFDVPEAGLEIMVGNSTPYRKLDYLERKVSIG